MSRARLGDRREFSRVAAAESTPQALRARVRPGRDVRLVDISRGGALVHATTRLLPGREVELQFWNASFRWCGRASVIRCEVLALAPEQEVRYRAAFQFSKPLDPSGFLSLQATLDPAEASASAGYLLPAAGSCDPV